MITVDVKKETPPKDIFFKGNIVTDGNAVLIIVSDNVSNNDFSGTVIASPKSQDNGLYLPAWTKKYYSQFTGTITITSK